MTIGDSDPEDPGSFPEQHHREFRAMPARQRNMTLAVYRDNRNQIDINK